jgi:hypothetical protein
MLPFVSWQAIALSQVKAKDGERTNASQDQVGTVPHRRKSLHRRLLEALFEPRKHKGGSETEVHRRLDRDSNE